MGTSVVLLAAGYGTRLYPLTKHRPKALLPLGTGVMLDAIMQAVASIPEVGPIALVSNHQFFPQFQAWQQAQSSRLELIDDGTTSPEARLGAIRDLDLALEKIASSDDVVVLGTDNLFRWSLADFVAFAKTKRPASSVAIREVSSLEEARRYGVVELDAQARVVRCLEKPAQPPSRTVALCVYYFPGTIRDRIRAFMAGGGNVDAPGFFLEWLVRQDQVYGFVTKGEWFDIGSQEAYQQALARWAAHPSGTTSPKRTAHRRVV